MCVSSCMGPFITFLLLTLGTPTSAPEADTPLPALVHEDPRDNACFRPLWVSKAVSISFAPDPSTGRTAETMERVKAELRARLRALPAGLQEAEGGEGVVPSEPPPGRP